MGDALQEHRLLQQFLGILAPHHRRRHAGEGRELVHHAADIAHLADDGVGALRKISGSVVISPVYLRFSRSAESWIGVSGFLISWAMRRATSAQAAVRWAPTRSVMSSKVTTKPSVAAALAGHLHAESCAWPPPRLMADLAAGPAHRLGHGAADQRRQFRHRFGIVAAFQFLRRGIEQARGGAVDDGDVAVAVQADHAGADARQHRFGEAAALVVQAVGRRPDRCAGPRAAGSCG